MIRFLRNLWVILKVRFTTPDLRNKPVTGDQLRLSDEALEEFLGPEHPRTYVEASSNIRKKRTEVADE